MVGHVNVDARLVDRDALGGLTDELIDDGLEVAGALERRELSIGARAFAHDLERVLHLAPASELVDNVVDEPRQHFCDELARR
jgi:hypothetical protein